MKITDGRRLAAILGISISVFSIYVLVPPMRLYTLPLGLLLMLLFAATVLRSNQKFLFSLQKAILILLAVLFLAVTFFRSTDFVKRTETEARKYLDGKPHNATGYVTKVVYEANYGSSYEIALQLVDCEKTDLGAMLSLPYSGGFAEGDLLTFETVFFEEEGKYSSHQKANGIFLSAQAEIAEKTGERHEQSGGFFESIRLAIQTNSETYIHGEGAGLATALLTGNREHLSGSIRLSFMRIGISHILAVSGLHLSIVIGGLDLFMRLITVPRKMKNAALMVCTFFFALICGLSASIVRAAIMHIFYYIADMTGEQNDSPTSLFIAIFLIMAVNPFSVYDVGMWMSFLATLGILATRPVISGFAFGSNPRWLRKLLSFFVSLVIMTVSAVFFTLPIEWFVFGGVSIFSPIANLIFIPLTQVLLYLLIMMTVFGAIPFLASPIGQAAQILIEAVLDLAEYFSDMKGIYASLRYPFVPWVIVFLIIGVLAVLFIKRVKAVHLFTVFAVCLVIYGVGYFAYTQTHQDSAYVYLQTDGKSDAFGVISRNETVVIDISTGGYSVLAEAVKHTEEFYACEIDVLVLTHYHSYHADTLHRLTEQVKIRRVLLPEPHSEQDLAHYREILGVLEGAVDTELYQTDGTQKIEVGNAVLTLPRTEYIKRSTHPITSFSVSVGEKGVSYFGESATETDLGGTGNDVVIFGSHGPEIRHIFDSSPFADAQVVIFTNKTTAALTETENLRGSTVFTEDYGGYISILFE